MTKQEFITLLKTIVDNGLDVHERVEMTEFDGTLLLDENGNRIINDVINIGDGRLYIARDGNERDDEQSVIDLLNNIEMFLPEIIAALEDK